VLVDADLFISILTADDQAERFGSVAREARDGTIRLISSSEVYNDVVSALRSQGTTFEQTAAFLSDMQKIPHRPVPTTSAIAADAMNLYDVFGGPGKLHYFDAFHVATARRHDVSLLTSDRFILENAERLGVSVIDPKKLQD